MPSNKKHHYVPKFLLRYFSLRGENKQLGVYIPDRGFFKNDCGLGSQAQQDYFYGSDDMIEGSLAEVEGMAAKIIREILEKSIIPKKKTLDYTWLLMFTVDQIYRTKGQVEEFSKSIHETGKHFAQFDEKLSKIDWENFTLSVEYPAALSVGIATKNMVTMSDLKYKLLINKTERAFITSDEPIVRYNQFFEKKQFQGNHTTMLVKGLQLFFPISPKKMLMFYDDWAYEVGKENTDLHITSIYDVDKLNTLQVINCHRAVYFNESIDREYLSSIVSKYGDIRKTPPSETKRDTMIYNKKLYMQIVEVGGNRLINLNLSFVRLTKKALKFYLEGIVAPFRKEEVRAMGIKKIPVPPDVAKKMLEIHPPIYVQ